MGATAGRVNEKGAVEEGWSVLCPIYSGWVSHTFLFKWFFMGGGSGAFSVCVSVDRSSNFLPDWNIFKAIGWIALKLRTDKHDFGDPLMFHGAASAVQSFHLPSEISQHLRLLAELLTVSLSPQPKEKPTWPWWSNRLYLFMTTNTKDRSTRVWGSFYKYKTFVV